MGSSAYKLVDRIKDLAVGSLWLIWAFAIWYVITQAEWWMFFDLVFIGMSFIITAEVVGKWFSKHR